MFPEVVQTARLRLEPRTPEYLDALEVYEYCREDAPHIDEVTEHLTWDPHPHPKETREFLERGAERWDDHESVSYAIRPREGEDGAGEVAGFGGMSCDWEKRTAVLGTWLRRPFWGRGYSGERAHALAELAFERLDLEVLAVSHTPGNEKSESAISRYIEEMGGRREGRLRNAIAGDPPRDEVRYTVTQAEWRDVDPARDVTFYDDAEAAPPRPGEQ